MTQEVGSATAQEAHRVDDSIRPQDDLFGHVNGTWLATAEFRADLSTIGGFMDLVLEAEAEVGEILREASEASAAGAASHGSNRQKIGDLFASFMDEDRVEALGYGPLAADLAAIDALQDLNGLAALLGRFQREDLGGLVRCYVKTDDRRSDRHIVNIAQGGLGLPDESYYRDDAFAEHRAKYVAHVSAMLRLIGRSPTEADDEAGRLMALETRLAAAHWDRVRCRDVLATYNLTALDEVRAAAPAFNWAGWIRRMGGTEDQFAEVIVRQPSFVRAISDVLAEVPLDDWKSWLTFHLIRRAAPYLSRAFVDESFAFYLRTLTGAQEQRDRWKRGVQLCNGAIGEAVGAEYVARVLPPDARAEMEDLVANLLEAYRVSIGRLDWMSAETRARALEKLTRFRSKIGYPNSWRDYSALEIARDDLIGNVRRADAFEMDRQLRKIGCAGRSRRVVHDAADRQRLLQPGQQRDLLPRRHPAATVFPGGRRPGAQLRRDRRGDRP